MPALEWHRDHLNLFPNPRYRPACLFVTCNAFRSTPPSASWPWKNANSHFIHLYLGDINPDLFLSKRSNSKSSIKRNIRPFSMENGRVVVRHSGKRINECRRERLPRFMKVKIAWPSVSRSKIAKQTEPSANDSRDNLGKAG